MVGNPTAEIEMAIADFEQFCNSFCEMAGIPPCAFLPDSRGMWSAMVRMRGVEVTLMQYATRRPGTAFLIADFGPMPEHLGVEGWLTLMNANLMHSGADSLAYSRDPNTGHVLLQKPLRLAQAHATDAYEAVTALVDTALEWRQSHFLPNPDAAFSRFLPCDPVRRASDEWSRASDDFAKFHEGLSRLLELDLQPIPPADPQQGRGFILRHSGVRFTVAHSAHENPDFAWLAIHLGPSSQSPTAEMVASAMEANFTLMAMAREAKFSRIGDTGELVLQFAFPLRGSSPEQFVVELGAFATLAREWERLGASQRAPLRTA